MPYGWGTLIELGPPPAKVGRPDRGDRKKVKAARRAARGLRR